MSTTKFFCEDCKCSFARKYILKQHLTSQKHRLRTEISGAAFFTCDCGKSYTHKKSMEFHKKTCKAIPEVSVQDQLDTMKQQIIKYEKQIGILLEQHKYK